MESLYRLYGYNTNKVVLMGFSVGGLATYTYGLSHADKFKGFIPIGAAINGTTEIANLAKNAKDKIFYLIHGSEDDLNNTNSCMTTDIQTESEIEVLNIQNPA